MTRGDYALGRLGGARSRLLAAGGLTDLLARADLPERLDLLRPSLWGASLPAAPAGRPAELDGVEAALAAEFRRQIERVADDLEGARRRRFQAFLLSQEAASLKGLLRALSRGLKPEEATGLLEPAVALGRAELLELAASKDAAEVASRLAAWKSPFARSVAEHAEAFRTPGGLFRLEAALDRVAFATALAEARGPGEDRRVLRRLTGAQADLANAALLLALAGIPEPPELGAPGGERIGEDEFRRLSGQAGAPLAVALARRLSDLLGPADAAAAELLKPLAADHLFGRALCRFARAEARSSPLSLAVPCAFALDLVEELRRVRLVLRATELGYPPSALLELLEA